MSTTATEVPKQEAPAFDGKAFMEARNKGEPTKPVPAQPAAEPVKVETAKDPEGDHQRPSRSMSRLQRAIGREQALREAAEAELATLRGKATVTSTAEPVEPKRADFPAGDEGMAQFLRAAQKFDKTQEEKASGKNAEQTAQHEQFVAHLAAMDTKCTEDIKTLPDWDAVAKASVDSEDAPEFDFADHKVFAGLMANSDMRAFVVYHFAKNPGEFQDMLDTTGNDAKQIKMFHRLEGKLEKLYSSGQAAQAPDPEKEPKDRKHPAEAAKPGGTATGDSTPVKPKPSSEVAARGGSPAPDEPAPGTRAWMQKRNQAQYGR